MAGDDRTHDERPHRLRPHEHRPHDGRTPDDRTHDDRTQSDRTPGDARSARGLDPIAVGAALRRMARAGAAPWLHQEVARRMGERLAPMRARPERIIDWWAGPGGGSAAVQAAYPRAELVPVEPDAAWAALRRTSRGRRWWPLGRGRPEPLLSDTASDAELGRSQLVWANMVLQFVVDPPALLARWHRLLDVDGLVVLSCLGPGTLRELREIYAACGWPAPTPGFIDMHDLGDMLVEAGFAAPVLDQETLDLRWRSGEALLSELRSLGGNTAPGRCPGLRTPRWRKRLLDALAERSDVDGSIGLSIEVAYGHGFKAAPRAEAGAPVAVSLDEMRAMVRKPRGRDERVR